MSRHLVGNGGCLGEWALGGCLGEWALGGQ